MSLDQIIVLIQSPHPTHDSLWNDRPPPPPPPEFSFQDYHIL